MRKGKAIPKEKPASAVPFFEEAFKEKGETDYYNCTLEVRAEIVDENRELVALCNDMDLAVAYAATLETKCFARRIYLLTALVDNAELTFRIEIGDLVHKSVGDFDTSAMKREVKKRAISKLTDFEADLLGVKE